VHILRILLTITLALIPYTSNAGNIIKCKDRAGNTVFTQNSTDCENSTEDLSSTLVSTKKNNKKVNYRFPTRAYISERGRWNIYVEKSMKMGNPNLYVSSLEKLNETLDYAFSSMPANARKKLSNINIFLLWGKASPLGGRISGMNYVRKGQPNHNYHLDRRWEHALIVYSAENLIYLSKLWSRKAIFHELSHAWHIVNWPEKHPPIYEAWKSAKNTQKFIGVLDIKGKAIKSAYARKNQLEYFAELSAMYFVGGNYYPFNKVGLKKYDLQGYKMVEMLWN